MISTTPSSEVLLALRDVHTYYGHVHAIKGVTLEVRRGEIVTLIGSNGAGKSTMLRSISGMVRPRSGSIMFRGEPIHESTAHQIVTLGMSHVPEGRRIFPQMTVDENLDLGAYVEKDRSLLSTRRDRVFELFPRLSERRKQAGGTLSGGEQQMLAIGRALMRDPDLLLLDEPTLGLAPVLVDVIFATIRRLNAEGKTILLVEQNAWQALRVAHRGYVLQTGAITLEGRAADLANDPAVRNCYLGDEGA